MLVMMKMTPPMPATMVMTTMIMIMMTTVMTMIMMMMMFMITLSEHDTFLKPLDVTTLIAFCFFPFPG